MKLEPSAFRHHVDAMMEKKQKAQLQMWIGHGLLIYSNNPELLEIWDEEYEDKFLAL